MKNGTSRALEAALESDPDLLKSLDLHRRKTVGNLIACYKGTLGARITHCSDCGKRSRVAHSCRNRSCPRCQSKASLDWLERQRSCLLDTRYFHTVFTLPHCLNTVIRQNRRLCLKALFDASASTLSTFAANDLKAKIGVTAVLHTWGQTLCEHYHLHCIVTAGGLSLDGKSWKDASGKWLFPVKALSSVFRGKYLSALERLWKRGDLVFHGAAARLSEEGSMKELLTEASRKPWVVYSKQPFAGPDQVLKYLSLYTHRSGISDGRILNMAREQGKVRFGYKDYAREGRRRTLRLEFAEFFRRFCLHILPPRFVKIRHYGLLANNGRKKLIAQARERIRHLRSAQGLESEESRSIEFEEIGKVSRAVALCPWCGGSSLSLAEVVSSGSCKEPSVVYGFWDRG